MREMTFEKLSAARLEALAALAAVADDVRLGGGRLETAGASLAQAAATVAMPQAAGVIGWYSALIDAVAKLANWRVAVRAAEPDADRHRRAALLVLDEVVLPVPEADAARWNQALRAVRGAEVRSIGAAARDVALLPLPVAVTFRSPPVGPAREPAGSSAGGGKSEDRVALVKFVIAGGLVDPDVPVSVVPGIAHEVVITVSILRWPPGAEQLILEPLYVDRRDQQMVACPSFHLPRPAAADAREANDWGRLKVESAHAFSARPYSVGYAGRFEPGGGAVTLLGGHFAVQSHDVEREPLTGFPEGDRAVLAVRDSVRAISPAVSDAQIESLLLVVRRLASVAGAAQQGHYFAKPISEGEFQRELLQQLRSDSQLGAEVAEGAKSAGGITDISFRGIPIELKVEARKAIMLDAAADYFDQARQYAAGNAQRLSVVCVLECAKKTAPPPGLAGDVGFRLNTSPDGKCHTPLVVVIIRGNLPRPSDHST